MCVYMCVVVARAGPVAVAVKRGAKRRRKSPRSSGGVMHLCAAPCSSAPPHHRRLAPGTDDQQRKRRELQQEGRVAAVTPAADKCRAGERWSDERGAGAKGTGRRAD